MAFIKFLSRVCVHWGALVTGGFGIGLLSTYQGVGHQVPPWVYWSIAGVAVFWACFFAWLDEHKTAEKALAEKNSIEQDMRQQMASLQIRPVVPTLKEAALKISREILDFYYARSKDAPELPEYYPVYGNDSTSMLRDLAELNQQQIDAITYKTETKEIYEYKFRRELRELVLRIKESGVTGEDVDSLAGFTEETHSEVFMIKVMASDLATIADRIPAS